MGMHWSAMTLALSEMNAAYDDMFKPGGWLHKRPHLDTVMLAREFLNKHIPKIFGMPLAQFVRAHKKWILDNIMPTYCDASRALKVLCDDAQSLELMERHSQPPRFQDSSRQRSPSRSAPNWRAKKKNAIRRL